MARLRVALFVPIALLTSLTLGACGNSQALAQARLACDDVHQALKLERTAEDPRVSAALRATDRAAAMSALLRGLGPAASATSQDGSWNALQTTIQESERVPLPYLVSALTHICQVADSSSPYLAS